MNETIWTENVILADADYVDGVAFDLTVNFERMLGRRIPPADLARWAECVALDGGVREGEHSTSVILVHERSRQQLQNFSPADYASELSGKAFNGPLGEFALSVVQTEAMVAKEELFHDMLQLIAQQKEVRRLMIVVAEPMVDALRSTLRKLDDDERRITLFTMQPVEGGAFRHEILGYSLMAALGISSSEIDEKLK